MNNKQLQTKRQTKKGFRNLYAKVSSTSRKKQRVSAAANPNMLDSDVPNASIGRALTIILVLHIVAIGVIYIGIKWNKGQFDDAPLTSTPAAVDTSNVNANLNSAFVLAGDTYEAFAARHQVDVNKLRRVNGNVTIHAGKTLFLPPQKIQVPKPAVVLDLPVSDRLPLPATNTVVNVQNVPKAVIVKPAQPVAVAAGQTYKVQPGDSIWRISHKYKVSQDALMQLNGMSSPNQLQAGKTIKIPAP